MEKRTECVENTEGAFHLHEEVIFTQGADSKPRAKKEWLLTRQSSEKQVLGREKLTCKVPRAQKSSSGVTAWRSLVYPGGD